MEPFDSNNNFHKIIVDLWHISRTALADQDHGTYERKQYVCNELRKRYPELVSDLSGKRLWLTVNEVLA